ncbi:TPA_asm: iron ABC transporter permease [Salmonella enterica]|nr:iron ABC transporter permease [Salmonella enterica]EAO7618221.1 iron ABC transporter permease [Salmonella enterica]EAQ6818889.1 iron ABC transporter permease [Salmonella enterica]EAU9426233.1 iron ABC transporter permease [Salmonella enterica]EBQ2130415.1 iron ABC transporter permease [Salmonella enterica]
MKRSWRVLFLLALLLLISLGALMVGRFSVPAGEVLQALLGDAPALQQRLIVDIRLPRVLLALIVGAGLSGAGAALQFLFRNPLAEPNLLGVSSGAAFGGILMMMFIGDGWALILGALAGGLLALAAVVWLAGSAQNQNANDTLLLILSGIVMSALFSAGVSLMKLLADPQNQLPSIVFWLMGSLAGTDRQRVLTALPVIGGGLILLWLLRYQLMVITVQGAHTPRLIRARRLALLAIGFIAAGSVAVCGVVGWVGLVVPHLVRMMLGQNHRYFLLYTSLAGASYFIAVDTLARTLSSVEIPLGVLTALLGAPMFAGLIRRIRRSQ